MTQIQPQNSEQLHQPIKPNPIGPKSKIVGKGDSRVEYERKVIVQRFMIRSKLTRNANRFYEGEILFTRRVLDYPEFSF